MCVFILLLESKGRKIDVVGAFLVQLVELIMKIGRSGSDRPSTCMYGADFEKREARRSALWVFGILVFLIGGGWLLFRWLLSF